MGTETQLCIRDALYRLAQNATKKQALLGGVRIDGSDTAYSSQLSEEVDAKTSDGAYISIESDPLSINKASRYFFMLVSCRISRLGIGGVTCSLILRRWMKLVCD